MTVWIIVQKINIIILITYIITNKNTLKFNNTHFFIKNILKLKSSTLDINFNIIFRKNHTNLKF
jgi:hypothetical protein